MRTFKHKEQNLYDTIRCRCTNNFYQDVDWAKQNNKVLLIKGPYCNKCNLFLWTFRDKSDYDNRRQ